MDVVFLSVLQHHDGGEYDEGDTRRPVDHGEEIPQWAQRIGIVGKNEDYCTQPANHERYGDCPMQHPLRFPKSQDVAPCNRSALLAGCRTGVNVLQRRAGGNEFAMNRRAKALLRSVFNQRSGRNLTGWRWLTAEWSRLGVLDGVRIKKNHPVSSMNWARCRWDVSIALLAIVWYHAQFSSTRMRCLKKDLSMNVLQMGYQSTIVKIWGILREGVSKIVDFTRLLNHLRG